MRTLFRRRRMAIAGLSVLGMLDALYMLAYHDLLPAWRALRS